MKTKLGSHFVKWRNVIFERCKFNQRKQEEGESVDSFITALHGLAEHCNYGALRSKMIRDRIVVGLLNVNVSIKLQTDPELTLEKATTLARQHKSVIKQQEVVRGEQKQQRVDAVEFKKTGERRGKQPQKRNKPSSTAQTPPRQSQKQFCTRSGKTPSHGKQHCPAREATCHKCSMCKTSKLAQVEAQPEEEQFLGTPEQSPVPVTTNPWEVYLTLNGVPVLFKIDTGADVSAISETTFNQLKGVSLVHSDRHLSS